MHPHQSYDATLAQSVGASILNIHHDAENFNPSEFEPYVKSQLQRAKDDGVTLLILKNRYGHRTRWCDTLQRMEEKEFFGAEKKAEEGQRLLFVSTMSLRDAINGDSHGGTNDVYDSWGDVVERGDNNNSNDDDDSASSAASDSSSASPDSSLEAEFMELQ